MPRRGFTLLEAFVIVAIVAVLAAILTPVFSRTHCSSRRESCQSNLKQIGLAARQYTADWDEKYPQVRVNTVAAQPPYDAPYGWADAIHPYHRSLQLYQCPSEQGQTKKVNSADLGFTDYWYNRNLSGVEAKTLAFSARTFLIGEGNDRHDMTNARYSKTGLPLGWETNPKSPAHRHQDGANYAFADGHVKWLQRQAFPQEGASDSYTFSVR